MEFITLNDGNNIPAISFGTFQIPVDGGTYKAVKKALELGIRHIDTAVAYFNEKEVGQAVKDSGITRSDIWITTKMWIQDFKYEEAKKSIDLSIKKLGTDYMDLYLLHQPYAEVTEAWRAMEEAKKAGKIRSIGISNMTPKFWDEFVPQFDSVPSVNQVEFNPYFQQKELRSILAEDNVKLGAWAPLGQGNIDLFNEPIIVNIAEKYSKNAGQVILRFEDQEGIIVFPKSTHKEKINSNMEIFDFKLTEEEMQ
jgi:2,5-didehydrogluconate reductase